MSDIVHHRPQTVDAALDNLHMANHTYTHTDRAAIPVCQLTHHLPMLHDQFDEVLLQGGQEGLAGVLHEGNHLPDDLGHIVQHHHVSLRLWG